MSDATFSRVIWKEYRLQRSFWIAIACLLLGLQLTTYAIANLEADPVSSYLPALFGIGMGIPAIFALGSGAMLFAGEREAETYDFQRALPVTARAVIAGKLLWAIGGSLVMVFGGWLSAWLFAAREMPPSSQHGVAWLGSFVAITEVLVWSVFFSLALHRVLWATVCGAVTAAILGFVAIPQTIYSVREILPATDTDYFLSTLPLRFVVSLAVLIVDLYLACRWCGADRARLFPIRDTSAWNENKLATAIAWPARSAVFAHLLWQAWRQLFATMLVVLGALLVLAVWASLRLVLRTPDHYGISRLPIVLTPAAATLIGSCLFWADQRREMFHYFAERGVAPRLVWFSRQCIGMLALLAWVVPTLLAVGADITGPFWAVALWHAPDLEHATREYTELLFSSMGIAVLCYSIGQLASLICRSGVIGLFCGILGSLSVSLWAVNMSNLQVPLWFSVAPLPLVFVWASWLRAPDWIGGKTNRRARLQLVASLVVPLLLVAISVVVFRVIEIPRVDPRLPLQLFLQAPTTAAAQTARMYQESAELYAKQVSARRGAERSTASGGDAGAGGAPDDGPASALVIEKFLAAGRRSECWFPTKLDVTRSSHSQSHYWLTDQVPSLANGVLAYCQQQESQGDPDAAWSGYEALLRFAARLQDRGDEQQFLWAMELENQVLERLPLWAVVPGQSAECVHKALKSLDTEHSRPITSPPAYLIDNYTRAEGILSFEPWAWSSIPQRERRWQKTVAIALPWERWRLRRLLDFELNDLVADSRRFEQALMGGTTMAGRPAPPMAERVAQWSQTSWQILRRSRLWPLEFAAGTRLAQETRRRAVRVQLALIAWRIEHGALPSRLEELAGSEVPRLPSDPYTGQPFLYRPYGVSMPVNKDVPSPHSAGGSYAADIAPGTPLLWSCGPLLRFHSRSGVWSQEAPLESLFVVLDDAVRQGGPTDRSLWQFGWGFPIPAGSDKKAETPQ